MFRGKIVIGNLFVGFVLCHELRAKLWNPKLHSKTYTYIMYIIPAYCNETKYGTVNDTCLFYRVGYFVNNDYESEELKETPPEQPEISKISRKELNLIISTYIIK